MKKLVCYAGFLALLGAMPTVHAADFILVNQDAPGAGLNDLTAAAPVGGNPGMTLGEQRRLVYQFALEMYGSLLNSAVPVRVRASFASLGKNAAGNNILGQAGPTSSYMNFFNRPLPDTVYNVALANALSGAKINVGEDDINSQFTTDIDVGGQGWYYGLDGRTPKGQTNFLDVVTHEIGHGLGFTGDNAASRAVGSPSRIYNRYIRTADGLDWSAMNLAQRNAAQISDKLVWSGPQVTAEVPLKLQPELALHISAPAAAVGDNPFATADFGSAASSTAFTGNLVQATYADTGNVIHTDGCLPITNGAALAGRIALIDRGVCNFSQKTLYAQQAGAVAVIIASNKPDALAPMAAGDANVAAQITIPTVLVTQALGNQLKANLQGLVAGGIGPYADHRLAAVLTDGVDAAGHAMRHVKLYAPPGFLPGSSVSHFDQLTVPTALMAPSASATVIAQADLDLTPALFMDIGWTVNRGNLNLLDCATSVPVSSPGGLIPGANAMTNLKLCAKTSATVGDYRDCTGRYIQSRLEAKLFKPAQAQSLKMCLVGSKADAQYAAWH
ncbi:PA domain-containing protein [Collimonas pratensis]|uniref:PA domain protein n=1 Tax=Collimonas pratensis TaxID=279113 RepID=A0ABM5Z579_9BURK|nr:PA domain-containing protein [Collimonas pratensis]AMP14282.1 PA domain protein [Collimonas pratensis]